MSYTNLDKHTKTEEQTKLLRKQKTTVQIKSEVNHVDLIRFLGGPLRWNAKKHRQGCSGVVMLFNCVMTG